MIFKKRLIHDSAAQAYSLESIRWFGTILAKALLILIASNFVQEPSSTVHADFVVLDDFFDDDGADEKLESFREFEDLDGVGSNLPFGGLILSQNPGVEAVLRYDVTYDYSDIDRFIFHEAFVFDENDFVAKLKIDSIEVATGSLGFDADFSPILTFDLDTPLGTANSLSFHFTSNVDPMFFSSSELTADFAAVPEPTSILLVGMTVACGGTYRLVRRRRKASVSVE